MEQTDEEVRAAMLSSSISLAVRTSHTNRNQQDLTLVCEGGLLVQTNVSLLATLSKRLGELFLSLASFPEVVIVPDVKKVVVEELLEMYSLKWDQRQVSSELREASDLLGFSISKKQESSDRRRSSTYSTIPFVFRNFR